MPRIIKDTDVVIDHDCLVLTDETKEESSSDTSYGKASKRNIDTLWQARIRAHRIMEIANEHAKNIIQSSVQKAQDEYDSVHQAGYDQGFIAGREEALAEVKTAVGELTKIISDIEEQEISILGKYENELKDLSLNIAEKVINVELEKNDELFLTLYTSALKQHNEQKWVNLSVSQYEAEFVTKNAEMLLSMAKGAQDIKINVLEKAPRGTCIVETPVSITDTSVQTQLHRLAESLDNVELCV